MGANVVHYTPSLQLSHGYAPAARKCGRSPPALRLGKAVGVCWGLAVLLGTARGCWGLPGMPGMRWLIEFAGDCWGLLVIAQTPVPPL